MKMNPEPNKIWDWLWEILDEVSDELGTLENGKYLLVYEGWGSSCVSVMFDPTRSDEENEKMAYKFAEKEGYEVIGEWIEKYRARYCLIDCGHDPTGLYGVTWALFKKHNDKSTLG